MSGDNLTKWDWIGGTTFLTSGILVLLSILGWLGQTGQYLGAAYGSVSFLFMSLAESKGEEKELRWEYVSARVTAFCAALGFIIFYLGAPWLPIPYYLSVWLGLVMLIGGMLLMEKFSEEVTRAVVPG